MAAYKDGDNASYDKFSKFVPKIWTARLLKNLQGKTVLKQYCTTEYQGEISGYGDTVSIPSVGRIALGDYNANNTSITYTSNDGYEKLVTVDKAKYWSTRVEDIEKAQAKPEFVNELMNEAAYSLGKNTEQYLYNVMVTAAEYDTEDEMGQRGGSSATHGGIIKLSGADGTIPTAASFYTAWLQIGERLTDLGAPEDGRFAVVPSFVKSILLDNDRFVGANAAGSDAARGKGYIGEFDGIALHVLPRGYFKAQVDTTGAFDGFYIDQDSVTTSAVADLATGYSGTVADDYKVLAGVKGAYAYVEQLSKTETLRLQSAFANGIRGLHVYGGGSVRPQWLVTAAVDDLRAGTVSGSGES